MPATQLNITEQLAAITGAEHVRSDEETTTVFPANTQQVSEILSYANKNQLTVSPVGGGTKQSWGNPSKTNIRLELTRLNRVIEHPWQDLTCTVQAGCTWQQLQQTLAKHGQFVALDPLWPERATVGGILATNDSGALRHRYGSLRDLVIGMTLVLADGTIARSGGRVVKNVAGYDLCKLLTGSLSTLAIITEATFRLHPLPQYTQTFTVSAPQAQQLAPLMASIRASHLLTQALQLRGDANGFHLDVQLNAHPEAHQDEILQSMAEAQGLKLDKPLTSSTQISPEPTSQLATGQVPAPASHIASQRDNGGSSGRQAAEFNPANDPGFSPGAFDNVWQARESLFSNKEGFVAKIGMLPTDVARIADDIARLGGTVVAQSLGVIYGSFSNTKRDYSPLGSLYAYTDAGSMTVLQKPSIPLDDPAPPWGSDKPNALMQAIKHQFDPSRTLNPGRFLGGI